MGIGPARAINGETERKQNGPGAVFWGNAWERPYFTRKRARAAPQRAADSGWTLMPARDRGGNAQRLRRAAKGMGTTSGNAGLGQVRRRTWIREQVGGEWAAGGGHAAMARPRTAQGGVWRVAAPSRSRSACVGRVPGCPALAARSSRGRPRRSRAVAPACPAANRQRAVGRTQADLFGHGAHVVAGGDHGAWLSQAGPASGVARPRRRARSASRPSRASSGRTRRVARPACGACRIPRSRRPS